MQPANPTTTARPIQLHWHEARQAQNHGRGLLLRPMLGNEARPCPYGQEGDTRWVQETWFTGTSHDYLKANALSQKVGIGLTAEVGLHIPTQEWNLRPFALMPRWASRLTIRLTAVQSLPFAELRESHADAMGIDELSYGRMGMNWEIGGGVTRDPLLAVALWLAQAYPVGKPDIDFVGGNFHDRAVVWEPQEPMVWAIEYEVIL